MIASFFHEGSGIGNQLFRYVTTRVLAKDKGYDFGMIRPDRFKGRDFMKLDMGLPVDVPWELEQGTGRVVLTDRPVWEEKKVMENGVDIRSYDPEINFIEDGTIIDGSFEDARYFEHRLDEIRQWLAVETLPIRANVCVIGFRGGEFTVFPDLFLTHEYWETAIKLMLEWNPSMKFEVHTDDPITARKFFPQYPIIHDIEHNWRAVRSAQYIIMANSTFYIMPALLGEADKIIAPRFWARRNTRVWATPSLYYKRFIYI